MDFLNLAVQAGILITTMFAFYFVVKTEYRKSDVDNNNKFHELQQEMNLLIQRHELNSVFLNKQFGEVLQKLDNLNERFNKHLISHNSGGKNE